MALVFGYGADAAAKTGAASRQIAPSKAVFNKGRQIFMFYQRQRE
jgi:hypothetical protein